MSNGSTDSKKSIDFTDVLNNPVDIEKLATDDLYNNPVESEKTSTDPAKTSTDTSTDPAKTSTDTSTDPEKTSTDLSNNEIAADDIDLEKKEFSEFIDTIFNKSNVTVLLWFLGSFLFANFIFRYLFRSQTNNVSRSIDTLFFIFILLVSVFSYYALKDGDVVDSLEGVSKELLTFLNKPISIITVSVFLIGLYICTFIFNIPMSSDMKPFSVSFIESSSWITIIILLFVNFFKYVFDISILDFFKEKEEEPEVEGEEDADSPKVDPVGVQEKEVFNVSNNKYTYHDAEAVCKAFDAELATYNQIENAYNNGGEWCNYGWSQNQLALFPTQKATWDKLQKDSVNSEENHRNDCGRPGINGGYIDNPYVKFGVNCFGVKPTPTEDDLLTLQNNIDDIRPQTKKEKELEKKINQWKKNKDKYLKVNSYNKEKWSKHA